MVYMDIHKLSYATHHNCLVVKLCFYEMAIIRKMS